MADEILKARAIAGIGRLARAVGKERFKPFLEVVSQKVVACLRKKEVFELVAAGFSYFADIARVLLTEFAPMLNSLVPLVIETCKSDQGLELEFRKSSKDNIDIGIDEEAEQTAVGFDSSFMDQKTAALHALGIFAITCPKEFTPYMKDCIETLDIIWNYFDETVREQVVQTYQQFVESLNLAYYGTESHPKPIAGLPAKVKLAPDAYKLYYKIVLPKYIEQIKNDEEKSVVIQVLESLADLCSCIGPAVVEDNLNAILDAILMLLNKKAKCLNTEEDENEGMESDDEEDSDATLMKNLIQLISEVLKGCGEAILPEMKNIFMAAENYLKPKRDELDWENGIACFASFFQSFPSIIPSYAPSILPLCFKCCTSDNDGLIQNSAYCIGVVVEKAKSLVEPYINDMLQALKNAYENSSIQEGKDNAVSSLLRMLVAYNDKLPLELIVPAIFENIPLKGDLEENICVSKSLLMLAPDYYQSNDKYLENILMTLVRTIVDDDCGAEDEDKMLIGKYLLKMNGIGKVEMKLRGMISKMSQTELNDLQKFMS